MHSSSRGACEFELNPYESFMRNHLKHYGYYTGQNESYKASSLALAEWERTRSFDLGDGVASDTEYENQALKESKLDDAFHKLNSTIAALSAFPSWQEMFYNRFTDGHKRTTQLVFSHSAGKLVPKLKEPRNLYALSKEAGPQQAPRWPADIEVLPDAVQHISYVPKERESFYQPTGFEKMPMTLSEGDGRTVYYNPTSKDAYFLRSRVGGSRKGCLPRAWKPKGPADTTLVFESRFESGNLMKVTQRSEFEYDLQLRFDLYTEKHTQWFYFRVQNVKKNLKYRFTITNFMKPGSLYNCGMKPLMYSETDAKTRKIGWRRLGEEIKYYKNDMRRTDVKCDRSYYSLTWVCEFPHDGDTCYFAHCYPYTYSDLQEYLLHLSNDPVRSKYCRQRVLCRSLAGNLIYILTITSAARNPDDAKRKKAVVLTARVHPGETNSSWMMKGFLDYLTSDSIDAKLLRDTFVFKIVPMLNPDGVIVGNYRCSLAGRDLNRNYRSVLRDSFPSVSNTKSMIKKLLEEREVVVYCDLHGHSRKQNVFIYGCENKKNKKNRLKERIFPIILGRNASEKFSSSSCKYKVQKSKEGTGRIVMWQMGIMNSYTMEATFCGSTLGNSKFYHFRTVDYEAMGYHFCDSLLDYCDPDQTKCDQIYKELEEKLKEDILNHLQRMGTPLPEGGVVDLTQDYASAIESSTTGSDSSADDGLPVHLIALAPKLTKKKKLKTRKERDKKRNSFDKSKEKVKEGKEKSTEKAAKPGTPKREEKIKKPSISKLKDADDMEKDQTLKYKHASRQTVHSAGRARHIQNRSGDGLPVFARERSDSKTMQKTEYLEALTNAYLMSGVLKSSSQDVPAFRYTPSGFGVSSSGLPLAHLEGLCPHHEKAFADQFVTNQLSGLTFEDDKPEWKQASSDLKQSSIVHERRSATPSKSTPFSLANMSTMRSQSESPPHYPPLPLDEYIRPTSRQGPSLMTGPIHRPGTPLRSVSMGRHQEDSPIEALATPQRPVASYADFVRRDSDGPSSSPLHPTNYTTSSGHGLDEYSRSVTTSKKPQPSSKTKRQLLTADSPSSSTSKAPPPERRMVTPVFIESNRESSQNKDANHAQNKVTVLRAHNTPVKSVSGSSPVDRAQNKQAMGARWRQSVKYDRQVVSSTSPQASEDASLRQSQGSALQSHHSPKPGRRSTTEEPKTHRCSVEATPISDMAAFTNNTVESSHHFKPSQSLYGSATDGTIASSFERLPVSRQASEAAGMVPFRQGAKSELGAQFVRPSSNFNNSSCKSNLNANNSMECHDGSDNNNGHFAPHNRMEKNTRKALEQNLQSPFYVPEEVVIENVINLLDVRVPDLDLSFPQSEIINRPRRREVNHVQEDADGFSYIHNNTSSLKNKPSSRRKSSSASSAVERGKMSPAHYEDDFAFENYLSSPSLVMSDSPPEKRRGKGEAVTALVEDGRTKESKQLRQMSARQNIKSSIASAEDLQNLQNEDGSNGSAIDDMVRKVSDIHFTIRTSREGGMQRSRRSGVKVANGSPSPPVTPRNYKNGEMTRPERQSRFTIGLPGTEILNRRNISPQSADHYIRVSKLALQYRQKKLQENFSELDQSEGGLREEDSIEPPRSTDGDHEDDVEMKSTPTRSKNYSVPNKMVAVVTPMTQRGEPVSQSRYDTNGNRVTVRNKGNSSQVLVHQGGFQGTKTNPSYIRSQQARKK